MSLPTPLLYLALYIILGHVPGTSSTGTHQTITYTHTVEGKGPGNSPIAATKDTGIYIIYEVHTLNSSVKEKSAAVVLR